MRESSRYAYGFAWTISLLLIATQAGAATPSSGTVSPTGPPVTWSAGPFTGSAGDPVSASCENSDCDLFTLTVTGTDAVAHEVTVRVEWTAPVNDFDLSVIDATTGSLVKSSGEAVSTFEQVTFPAQPGTYTVQTLVYRAVNESITGRASVAATGATPEPPNVFRTATYQRFDFDFTPEVKLPEQERSLVFIDQDVEPEIEVDRFGTIYIGAIRGIGGGTDFWRSDDAGATFQYLGEPDGSQNPNPVPPSPEAGAGGGDVDVALGDPFYVVPPSPAGPGIQSTGRVYVTSLWLGSATLSVSIDRGDNWVFNPFTTAQLDRQWNVARGEKTLYMSLRKLVEAETRQHDVFVVQSDDGLTFTKGSFVQDPATGVPDDVGGNSALTSDGTLLGTFVSLDGKDLYLWKNPKSGTPPPANLPVGPTDVPVLVPDAFEVGHIFHGAGNLTTNNTFPIMTVDQGDNIHIAFADRHNIYLISCPAGANPTMARNWTDPVALNAPGIPGFEFTTTTIFPWIRGGASGKVAVLWYGTPIAGDPDTPAFETQQAPWRIIYAQVENALSEHPDVYLDIASQQGGDGVIHKGQICVRGLGCPDGTRELAEYSSVAVDPAGFPNIAYTGTIINGTDPPSTGAITFFTKATKRPLSTSPVVTHIECGDSRVTEYGGWHEVKDSRATRGVYCRNVGANKDKRAYLELRYSGTKLDLEIARGPRGGNAEVFIDGQSKGNVDFFRAPSDPLHPDNSGRKDLTLGEFVSFATTNGTHTFRLEVRNNGVSPVGSPRDMVYVDGFDITGGAPQGQGNPIDIASIVQGIVLPSTSGGIAQPITVTNATMVAEVIFEKEA